MHKHLKQVHLRPYVLVLLLHFLIEQGHEAFRGKASPEVLKERMRLAVEARYPEPEGDVPAREYEITFPGIQQDHSTEMLVMMRHMVTWG